MFVEGTLEVSWFLRNKPISRIGRILRVFRMNQLSSECWRQNEGRKVRKYVTTICRKVPDKKDTFGCLTTWKSQGLTIKILLSIELGDSEKEH